MEAQSDTLTLRDLTTQAQEQLAAVGTPESEMTAKRIVAEATGLTIADLALEADSPAKQGSVARADEMLERSVKGEPLQYVLGRWGFRGLDLAVDRRAFIPRPETETLAGEVIHHLKDAVSRQRAEHSAGDQPADQHGAVQHDAGDQPADQHSADHQGADRPEKGQQPTEQPGGTPVSVRVADLGTGTGAIALSIAQEVPEAVVIATDNSQSALDLARENLTGLGSAGARVTLSHGDWCDALDSELLEQLDAVVSNPPYVPEGEKLPASVVDWEPETALFSTDDGLGDLNRLITDARFYLSPAGMLALECAPEQVKALAKTLNAHGYDQVQIYKDLAGKQRGLKAIRPLDDPSFSQLQSAAEALCSGGFVVAPTDTVCGVLADYANAVAVRSVYAAKGRPETMPLPVLVSGIDQADRLVVLNEGALSMAQRHWPGALTLVAPRRGGVDPVGGHTTLGVRTANLGWLRWLANEVGPLTGTSANCHRGDTPRRAVDAAAALLKNPAYVVEGEAAPLAVASTVVDVCKREPVVLREGELKTADLLNY